MSLIIGLFESNKYYDPFGCITVYFDDSITPNKEGKYSLPFSKGFDSYYLPSVDRVMSYLGLPSSPTTIFPSVSLMTGNVLPIKKTTLYAIFKEGVGKRSFGAFIHWLASSGYPFLTILRNKRLLDRSGKATENFSNAGGWLGFLAGYEMARRRAAEKELPEFRRLASYLRLRLAIDEEWMAKANMLIKSGDLNKKDLMGLWREQRLAWNAESNISEKYLDHYEALLKASTQKNSIDNLLLEPGVNAAISMHLDFYLGAIAAFDVGYIELMNQSGAEEKVRQGIIIQVIQKKEKDSTVKTYFHAMLDVLLEKLNQKSSESVSEKQLSRCILLNEKKLNSDSTLEEKQWSKYKSWRKGVKPSMHQITHFVDRAVELIGLEHSYPLQIYFSFAKLLDTLQSEITEQLLPCGSQQSDRNLEEVSQKIAKAIAKYTDYYHQESHRMIQTEK